MRAPTASVAALALALAPAIAAAQDTVFGITANQTLITFAASDPMNILSGTALSGLQTNETILGIDFRPATGQLYALGSSSRLYTINPATGLASQVGAGTFTTPLNGSSFGFDFNPTIDRIRVVSEANQNIVLHPDTGAVAAVATPLFYAAGDPNEGKDPNVVGSAYNNNFVPTPTSQLFGIDTGLDILVKQANNAGTLTTVGPLGANITSLVGFDISPSGIAYAASVDASSFFSTLWTIDLNTGAASSVGQVNGGVILTAIAVVPTPASACVLAAGLVAAARRRR